MYIFLFEGLGQSDYSLLSPNYGKWKKEGLKATHDDPTLIWFLSILQIILKISFFILIMILSTEAL